MQFSQVGGISEVSTLRRKGRANDSEGATMDATLQRARKTEDWLQRAQYAEREPAKCTDASMREGWDQVARCYRKLLASTVGHALRIEESTDPDRGPLYIRF
jgi:hypothetical protein